MTPSWWPWHDAGAASPAPDPAAAAADDGGLYELTSAALHALHKARTDEVNQIIEDAFRRYGNGPFPGDVLLDIRLALRPVKLRPDVPVIPGPDGARRA